jgi:hypothetical protein
MPFGMGGALGARLGGVVAAPCRRQAAGTAESRGFDECAAACLALREEITR